MAEVDFPQKQRVEKADQEPGKIDNAMSFSHRVHDELAWTLPRAEQNNDNSNMRLGARLDELSTGDTVVHAGGKVGVSMPSGEHLQLDGNKGWVLKDSNGKEIANSKTENGQLSDGAQLSHVVPFMGKGWTTLSYPNGDLVTIDQNGVNIERGGKRVEVPLAPMAPREKKK